MTNRIFYTAFVAGDDREPLKFIEKAGGGEGDMVKSVL